MSYPLMPKATAVWLIDNTALSFDQIADFTGIHILEIQAMADGDVLGATVGLDPVMNGQLTKEEIARCEADPSAKLELVKSGLEEYFNRKKSHYTPVSRRSGRPSAIMWLIRNLPELSDAQICKLVSTTKPSILAIRNKTHKNIANIEPRNPVSLGLCSEEALEKAVIIARDKAGTTHQTELPKEV